MSSETLRDAYRAFTTGCALITTDGPRGPNVMAAEWTFNVSYDPFLILVSIDPANKTHDMILESKEFGVSVVAESQLAGMAFAGHYSKADTDKLSSDLFETYPAKKIRAPMIRGSLLNAECRLVQHITLGDHMAFLGEVVEFSVDPEGKPVVLHRGSRRLGERIQRAPAVAVAVTPMRVSAGESVQVVGQLTAPDRAGVPVSIDVRGPGEVAVSQATLRSEEDGSFRGRVDLPARVSPGRYLVTAQAPGVDGRALFEVS